MSAESSYGDSQLEEWTVVNRNDDDETLLVQTGIEPESAVFSLESKISELKAEEDSLTPRKEHPSDSSDSSIERISEDGLEENQNLDRSFGSTLSGFSVLANARDGIEADVESLASSNDDDLSANPSKDDVPIDLNVKRIRLYIHTPNNKLNWALNVLMILSVTMVVGVGIGHFVGWYGQWMNYNSQLNSHVVKLKALQLELDDCLQNPMNSYENDDGELTACYEKIDFWKNRYTDILAENQVLQSVVQQAEEEDDKCEEPTKELLAEYRKLKFHLIEQQLENVATLRRLEVLNQQKMDTLNRMKHLEVENEELKEQVEDEKLDDVIDEQNIRLLQQENAELKEMLAELQSMTDGEQDVEKKTDQEMGDLRQQVNQLRVENSELQTVIAKLRYGAPSTPLVEENGETSDYGSAWLADCMPGLNLTGFLDYLTKVATDRETVQKEMMQFRENLHTLSEQAKRGITTGKDMFIEAQKSFQAKWDEMTKETAADALQNMGKALRDTVQKLYVLGADTFGKLDDEGSSKFQKKVNKLMLGLEEQWSHIKSKMFGGKESQKKIVREEQQKNDSKDPEISKKSKDERHRSNDERESKEGKKKKKAEKGNRVDKASMKIIKDKEEKKSRGKRNVRFGPKNVGNDTSDNGDWVFERARSRDEKRKEQKASDWLFDRAHERKESRQNAERDETPIEWEKMKTQPNKEKKSKKKNRKSDRDGKKKKRKERQRYTSNDEETDTDDEDVETWERNWGHRSTKFYRRTRWSIPDINYRQTFFNS